MVFDKKVKLYMVFDKKVKFITVKIFQPAYPVKTLSAIHPQK